MKIKNLFAKPILFKDPVLAFIKFASLYVSWFVNILFATTFDNVYWGSFMVISASSMADYYNAIHTKYGRTKYCSFCLVVGLLIALVSFTFLYGGKRIPDSFIEIVNIILRISVILLIITPLLDMTFLILRRKDSNEQSE